MAKKVTLPYSDELRRRENLPEIPAVWENGLREATGPGFFEWWYFDGHFDDGSTVVILFLTKPITERKKDLKPNIMFTITLPDGKKIADDFFFNKDQFSALKDHCEVHIGPNWIKGDLQHFELHVKSDKLGADLVFTGKVPAWRPGAGKNYYSDDYSRYFGWLVAIPYGTVEGTLTYENQDHPVKGNCYHDHNWGNVSLEQVMDHWYWGRAHINGFSTIFIVETASKSYGYTKIPVFMLAKEDQILVGDGRPLTLKTNDLQEHPGGKKYPKELDFIWQTEDESIRISLRKPILLEANSLLYYLPNWQRVLARLIVNPYYFRFKGELKLEVNLKQVKAVENGEALFEIMMFT